jgi:hypothetical protein
MQEVIPLGNWFACLCMHSDAAYDVDDCDCSLRDCSLNASIVMGFLLEASMFKSLDSRVQRIIWRCWMSDRKASCDFKHRRGHGSDAEQLNSQQTQQSVARVSQS